MGELGPSTPPPPARRATRVGPFAIFGLAAILAAAGAVFEMSYYDGSPIASTSVLGTTIGILLALVAFFVIGLKAPPND